MNVKDLSVNATLYWCPTSFSCLQYTGKMS